MSISANKTGKLHVLQMNATLRRHLEMLPRSEGRVFPVHYINCLLRELARLSETAKVRRVTPQTIRRAAATAYERTQLGASSLIFGHSLWEMTFLHYVSALEVLRPVAEKLPQPRAFRLDRRKRGA